jgi:hypothetical protein
LKEENMNRIDRFPTPRTAAALLAIPFVLSLPAQPARAEAPAPEPPAPEPASRCLSAFGETACGWDCVAAFGQVRCADWPYGACFAAFGDVVCGPAAPRGWRLWVASGDLRPAECLAAFGRIACGWGCVAAFGDVRCAALPWGTCAAAFGEVTCGP